ncbi:MAG: methyltransferase [Pseudohongiella sp.]|nr:methyltransferase [Pseudohongiella sp.]MDO9520055.1 methyltransferase [Pseudohongiella sp.]MDP2127960.1 methyltransferase [Pseudohongiella sp.]
MPYTPALTYARKFACMGLMLASSLSFAADASFESTRNKLWMAMEGPARSQAEIARDLVERKPVETLEFFRFRDNMRVMELIPGAGWYTKILAPTLRGSGKLYLAIGTDSVEEQVLTQPGFDEVEVLRLPEGMTLRNLSAFEFDVTDLDMVLTFRNLHNMSEESRKVLNDAVFKALKPGGLYGVKDHTRRHLEADNRENGRRLDPVLVIKEIQDTGFELVDFSSLHASEADALNLEVGHESVTGRTDRFTLLFRKR